MQIGPNQTYFIDPLPSPTLVQPAGRGAKSLSEGKNSFTLRIKVVPTLSMGFTVKLFDQNNYEQFQSWYDANIEVNGGNQTYAYILNQVINNGYLVYWAKIRWRFSNFATDNQLKQPFSKVYIDANGETQFDTILGIEDIDIYQRKLEVIDIDLQDSPMLLDGITYLQYSFVQDPAPMGMYITFFYKEVDKSNTGANMNKNLSDLLTSF